MKHLTRRSATSAAGSAAKLRADAAPGFEPGSRPPIYEAASVRAPRMRHWLPGNTGANAALFFAATTLRNRARDQVRQNGIAKQAIRSLVTNLVGSGIKPRSRSKNPAFRDLVHETFLAWTDDADAAGTLDFYGLQALACRSMIEGGDVFIRRRPRRMSDGLVVPLQIQLLESEYLVDSLTMTLGSGNTVRQGIEFNKIGRRVAYYLWNEHPGDRIMGVGDARYSRVPASEIAHLYDPLRPGQMRGVTWLASTLVKLEGIDTYDDAMVERMLTSAMFAGFITRTGPEDGAIMGEGQPNAAGVAVAPLEPGTMQVLQPDEDVKFSQPPDAGANYQVWMRQQMRAVATGPGTTYEQLTGDLSQLNYSSIRAGLVEFRRWAEMTQHSLLVFQMCRPIWKWWMDAAVISQALKPPVEASPLDAIAKWMPPGFGWVDPKKEFDAMIAAIRAGIMSRQQVVAEYGYDIEEIDAEIAADNDRADRLGLVLDTDPRKIGLRGDIQDSANAAAAEEDTHPGDQEDAIREGEEAAA